jgi:hypothetical protein
MGSSSMTCGVKVDRFKFRWKRQECWILDVQVGMKVFPIFRVLVVIVSLTPFDFLDTGVVFLNKNITSTVLQFPRDLSLSLPLAQICIYWKRAKKAMSKRISKFSLVQLYASEKIELF